MSDETNEDDGPRMTMEECLYAGLSHADFNFDDVDERSRKLIESVGSLLVEQQSSLAVPQKLRVVADHFQATIKEPWFDFAIDYQLGQAGTFRVMESFSRFRKVIPVYVGRQLGSKAQGYLREAIGCYLLVFDVACIVFCRAAVEALLKDTLASAGHPLYQDLASAPTAGKVVDDAYSKGILRRSVKEARNLKRTADHVLHRAMPDEKILPQQALDSINDLAAVLTEVLGDQEGEIIRAPSV